MQYDPAVVVLQRQSGEPHRNRLVGSLLTQLVLLLRTQEVGGAHNNIGVQLAARLST